MSSYATADQTSNYLSSIINLPSFNTLGNTGLYCSPAGFGGYRINPNIAEHRAALETALRNGINLIDTSANYGDGGSEQLIGQVLSELISGGTLNRDAVVIVSKAGYLQGTNLKISEDRKVNGNEWPDLVEYGPGIEHCIHPEFLCDQLEKSLQRLQLKTIDVYLLHNPEYYLSFAHKVDIPLADARQEFYQRIEKAFRYLESEVVNGRIRFYGVSSNTFPGHSDDYNFICLENLYNIAESISSDHHFQVVQMPMNLIEHQAVTTINQPAMHSAVEFADIKNIGLLINRPLNAYINRRIFRLVDITGSIAAGISETEEKLNELIRQENHFERSMVKDFELDENTEKMILELFSTGSYLAVNWQKLGPYHQWINSQAQILVERINHGMEILTHKPDLTDDQKKWIDFYIDTFNDALDGLTARYRVRAAKEVDLFKKEIQGIDDQWDQASKLSRKAIRAIRTTRGISCTLVGMRHEEYVMDVLEELKSPVEIRDEMHSWLALKEQLKGLKFE